MSKFGPYTFDKINKPVKRALEEAHAKKAQELGVYGNVLSLTGPEVITHFATWSNILSKRGHFVICEKDMKKYSMMRDEILTLKENKMRVRTYLMDVFDAIMRHGQSLAVLDLDFCVSLETLIKEGLYENLEWVAENHFLKRSGSCLIITASARGRAQFDKAFFRNDVPVIFEKHDYEVDQVTPHRPGYKGGKYPHTGCPMYSVMYYLRKNNGSSAKKRRGE